MGDDGGGGGDSLRATLYNNRLLLCWIKECPLGTAEPKHFRYILTKYYPLGGKWLRLCAFYFFFSIFPRPTYFSVVIDCWLYTPPPRPSPLSLPFCSFFFTFISDGPPKDDCMYSLPPPLFSFFLSSTRPLLE